MRAVAGPSSSGWWLWPTPRLSKPWLSSEKVLSDLVQVLSEYNNGIEKIDIFAKTFVHLKCKTILLDSSIANIYRYIWTCLLFVSLNGLAMRLCFNSVWSLRFGLPYREVYSRYLRPWQVSLLWNHRKDWRASHRQCLLGPRLSGKRGLMLKEALLFCYVGTELSYSPLQILKWKYLPEALWLEIFGSSTNTFIILGLNTITRY